ncbi:zinc-binding dehydrogenase [Cryptosporangium arvum]|uniref:Zn-dependent oxidoreductase, NADPH:quinone reductase n=1 Tax=Cryptosporangium arvum DSM 44712 TaxID=927661 RepID=A0A010ZLI3_9ACTN|nr:zinc-binding dehydrogenase [Cryptosporangium arvum]EXG79529.1 Zn-dependent oxidoreductase, NADPH:quinone reductase [Cryptosporangium arvum DSM 44712]
MSDYAIRLGATGGPEVLRAEAVELPPPGPDEVRIRQTAIDLSHDDVLVRTGSVPAELPTGLGSSAVGVVEAAGSRADVAVGERVAYATVPFGAYATVRNVPAEALVPLPDTIGDEDAAAVLARGLLVWALIRRVHRVEAGETVVFHAAADGVGLIAGQWLSHLGARPIGTVGAADEVRLAIENGYDEIVLDRFDDLAARARELTDGVGVPVVYDPLGVSTVASSTAALGPHGLLVSSGPRLTTHLPDATALRAASAEVLDLVVRGVVRPNLRQRFDLADAGKAQEALESRALVGATVLLP